MIQSTMKAPWPTLIACAAATYVLSQRGLAWLILFVALPLAFYLLRWLWVAAKCRVQRPIAITKILMWTAGILIALGFNVRMYEDARKHSASIVEAIDVYTRKAGTCPPDLAAIGFDPNAVRGWLGTYRYGCERGVPYFFYRTTFMLFDTETYDFRLRQWEHKND